MLPQSFLIASNHAPILSLVTPTHAQARRPFAVQATVCNPSPVAVQGTATLIVPQGWQVERKPMRLAARQSATVTLKVVPGAASTRSMLVETFDRAGSKKNDSRGSRRRGRFRMRPPAGSYR